MVQETCYCSYQQAFVLLMTTKKRRIDMKSLKKTGRNHEIFQKIFELRLQVKSILSARGFLAKQKKTLWHPGWVLCKRALLYALQLYWNYRC